MSSEYLRYEKNVGLAKQGAHKKISDDMAVVFPEYQTTVSMEDEEDKIDVYFGRFPSSSVGEGVKKHFMLSFDLESKPNCIVGIEEPEIHLHPSKQREVYDFILERSTTRQVLMTTHSPVIASKSRLSDLFLVTIDSSKVTTIQRVTENLVQTVIDELGIKQSDFFDSDCVTFVEGKSDVAVFAAVAAKLHPELKVSFLDSEGWGSIEYYANARILTSRKLSVHVFAIFDGDTQNKQRNTKAKDALTNRLQLPPEHVITLKRNSIEDYLLNARAIRSAEPQLQANEFEIASFISGNSGRSGKDVLDGIFRKYGGIRYKESIHAGEIAKALTVSEIDDELIKIINGIFEVDRGV